MGSRPSRPAVKTQQRSSSSRSLEASDILRSELSVANKAEAIVRHGLWDACGTREQNSLKLAIIKSDIPQAQKGKLLLQLRPRQLQEADIVEIFEEIWHSNDILAFKLERLHNECGSLTENQKLMIKQSLIVAGDLGAFKYWAQRLLIPFSTDDVLQFHQADLCPSVEPSRTVPDDPTYSDDQQQLRQIVENTTLSLFERQKKLAAASAPCILLESMLYTFRDGELLQKLLQSGLHHLIDLRHERVLMGGLAGLSQIVYTEAIRALFDDHQFMDAPQNELLQEVFEANELGQLVCGLMADIQAMDAGSERVDIQTARNPHATAAQRWRVALLQLFSSNMYTPVHLPPPNACLWNTRERLIYHRVGAPVTLPNSRETKLQQGENEGSPVAPFGGPTENILQGSAPFLHAIPESDLPLGAVQPEREPPSPAASPKHMECEGPPSFYVPHSTPLYRVRVESRVGSKTRRAKSHTKLSRKEDFDPVQQAIAPENVLHAYIHAYTMHSNIPLSQEEQQMLWCTENFLASQTSRSDVPVLAHTIQQWMRERQVRAQQYPSGRHN
eukprot:TRINITY_DN2806_c0_g1_i1.p1 TRINITY_DN2806_c0_g1~~TRINITY_DN2806_c0_g1_i1.p1  ORF type:complete len:558 (+),score=72.40 TRINITY_DN2806_c0_g1_i1:871-2544(+)